MTIDEAAWGSALGSRIAELDLDAMAAEIHARSGAADDVAATAQKLTMYLNEGYEGVRTVRQHLPSYGRVLEVGSGIGFFAGFLAAQGVDIVELEPSGLGFEFMSAARSVVRENAREQPPHLDISVDELDPAHHGRFDFIFSLNVIEHLPNWRRALDRMREVLAPGGQMLHLCPNYAVPYEPHFGVPLLPFRPQSTGRVLPSRIVETDLWASLNWVTSRQVRRWARQRGMLVSFRRGLMADAISRLASDPEFRRRHEGVVSAAAGTLDRMHLVAALRRLPVAFTTPMEFRLSEPVTDPSAQR